MKETYTSERLTDEDFIERMGLITQAERAAVHRRASSRHERRPPARLAGAHERLGDLLELYQAKIARTRELLSLVSKTTRKGVS